MLAMTNDCIFFLGSFSNSQNNLLHNLIRHWSETDSTVVIPLAMKEFFLISKLNLPCCSLRPFLILLLIAWEKKLIPHLATTFF